MPGRVEVQQKDVSLYFTTHAYHEEASSPFLRQQ